MKIWYRVSLVAHPLIEWRSAFVLREYGDGAFVKDKGEPIFFKTIDDALAWAREHAAGFVEMDMPAMPMVQQAPTRQDPPRIVRPV